jgi:acetylornithine/succinyldiaminopimelate/putrescine aminotransferase
MDIENRYLANVFSKKPLVLTKGKGALVWDINGKLKLSSLLPAIAATTMINEQNSYKNSSR